MHKEILFCLMALLLSFWLVSSFTLHCSISLTVAKEVFVGPSNNVTCSSQSPCLTLNEYAREADQYFVDNTTFLFLPGVHYLDHQLKLKNLSNLTFLGSYNVEMTQIFFSNGSKIAWTNCMNINVSHFVLNGPAESEELFSAALTFHRTRSILSNVTVFGNYTLRAIFVNDESEVSFNNLHISGASSDEGSALLAVNSKVNFYGSNSFINNTAIFAGGAIALYACTSNFVGNISFVNNIAKDGGAVHISDGSHIVSGCISFINNTASNEGGAIALYGCISNFDGNISFVNNIAKDGGAVHISDGSHIVSGCISFINNTASNEGGAIALYGCTSNFVGNISFVNNSANDGGAVYIFDGSHIVSGCISFINNTAISEGGVTSMDRCTSNFVGNNILFINNTAYTGGAMTISDGNHSVSGNISFIKNSALDEGGAIQLNNCTYNFSGNILFINNTATWGGAMFFYSGNPIVSGNITFINNSASADGGAVELWDGTLVMSGDISFINNTAKEGGAIYIIIGNYSVSGNISFNKNSAIFGSGAVNLDGGIFVMSGNISFINNKCTVCEGGAVSVEGCGGDILHLTGLIRFVNNSANQGGAMAFSGKPRLLLSGPLKMEFIENHADSTGGAISFVENSNQCVDPHSRVIEEVCLIELSFETNIHLNFHNNTAGDAGTVLYGGALDSCKLYTGGGVRDSCGNIVNGSYSYDPLSTIRNISNITSSDNLTSDIVSDSLQVCVCEDNGHFECDKKTIETVTGKEIILKAVIVDRDKMIVPMSVRIYLDNDVQLINATQRIQKTGKGCTELKYRLFSGTESSNITLVPDCRGKGLYDLHIQINFRPCPDAFIFEKSKCVCEDRLQEFNVTCNVDNNSIERTSNSYWIGIVLDNKTYIGLILHSGGCPFDYCHDTPVSITLDNLDVQCNHNHSGTLCGPCKENHSIALGTLHCLDCSNAYLALILPFVLAGVVLVAVLLLLNLSVAVGTVNGLIFYTNVVQANRSIFLPLGETNILTVFIAWLNLDLGIETCFYDGMDAYAFTWLQFLFPLYVWILIGLIIIASNYSRKIAQSLGNNPVPTLATLFLLSYSKILRNIIATLSVTSLDYPDGTSELVWLYDGSVPYFQRAYHIVLGIFAISVLLLLFLPYTLFLLFGQCLQAYSHHRVLSWINKIKPFMDAYHAPYKKETRYWTGLILLVRCILFLIFAVNSLQVGENHFDLLFTTTVTASLAGLAWIQNGVYDKIHNNILEASFIFNLCIFSAATFHVKETGGNQAALAYISVGIAFATFILIFLYHVYLLLSKTSLWKKVIHFMKDNNYRPLSNLKSVNGNDGSSDSNGKSFNLKGATAPVDVPTTIVELCEPLLIHPESTPDYT